MNAIVFVCLLSVSQRSIYSQPCGCCKSGKCPASAAPVRAVQSPQASPLEQIQKLNASLAENGRELVDARRDGREESVKILLDDRGRIQSEIDRVQCALVKSHKLAWSHGSKIVAVDYGAIRKMQAYAVRRGMAGLGR